MSRCPCYQYTGEVIHYDRNQKYQTINWQEGDIENKAGYEQKHPSEAVRQQKIEYCYNWKKEKECDRVEQHSAKYRNYSLFIHFQLTQ